MSTACRSAACSGCWPGIWARPCSDLTASLRLVRRGARFTLGLRAYFYLALAQYLAGEWDDVLLTAEQGFSAAAIHSRRYELPLLHLAAGCVPAGRGAAEEAERHARLAEEAAASLDYGQERVYAAMARALVLPGVGRLPGHGRRAGSLAGWFGPGRPQPGVRGAVAAAAGRGPDRLGPGRQAAAAWTSCGPTAVRSATCGRPWPGWRGGWPSSAGALEEALADLRGRRGQRRHRAARCTRPGCCWPTAGCCGAPGQRRRRSNACGGRNVAVSWRCGPRRSWPGSKRSWPPVTLARQPGEEAVCPGADQPGDRGGPPGREGLSNPEIAAELFISRKAVEYHLGNIYAKCGLPGRQELRRFVEQWRQPAAV